MNAARNHFLKSIAIPLGIVLLLWAVHITQLLLGVDLGYMGVFPRRIFGLVGIFTGPFVHVGWSHLVSNSVPLFVSAVIIIYFYPRVSYRGIAGIYVLTGLSVWIFARPVFHVGASGVVYGLVAFIFWSGIFRRNLKSIVLALIVTFLYSGMLAGVVPADNNVSWESHLLGAIMGGIISFMYRSRLEPDELESLAPFEADETTDYVLDAHVFDKTKAERRAEELPPPLDLDELFGHKQRDI